VRATGVFELWAIPVTLAARHFIMRLDET